MPLSDRERQILADIEARLRQEDPKFAETVSSTTVASHLRRQLKVAVAAGLLGFVLLLSAVPLARIWVGAVGFAVMVGAVAYGGNLVKRLGRGERAAERQGTGGSDRRSDEGPRR